MKSILDLFRRHVSPTESSGDTATVRKIARALETMEPERARFLAAFAYLLSRVANADLDISDAESLEMAKIVQNFGDLPEEQATLTVEIAKGQSRLFAGTEDFQVAREFKQVADRDQRTKLLHCLFAVAAADDEISSVEEEQIRQIADELGLSHREFADVRSSYNEKRAVLQRLSD